MSSDEISKRRKSMCSTDLFFCNGRGSVGMQSTRTHLLHSFYASTSYNFLSPISPHPVTSLEAMPFPFQAHTGDCEQE